MPVYEYQCLVCETSVPKNRSINDKPETYFCETCGYSLKRVYSTIGVTFNGNGFYSKDK